MKVLAYSLSHWLFFIAFGHLGAEGLLFLHLVLLAIKCVFLTVFAQQCCVTGGEKVQGPGVCGREAGLSCHVLASEPWAKELNLGGGVLCHLLTGCVIRARMGMRCLARRWLP